MRLAWRLTPSVLLVCAVWLLIAPTLSLSSNCGGNSAAMNVCRTFTTHVWLAAAESDVTVDEPVTLAALLASLSDAEITDATQSHWISAAFLIRDPSKPFQLGTREILIVSDRPYSNVPRPSIFNLYRGNPAHAIGYADGTSGLISPSDFRNLDPSKLVTIREWLDRRSRNAAHKKGA
jgi:hypothetical protein